MRRTIATEPFYRVGGAIGANAPSYVQRQADHELLAHAIAGDFCYVLTPRQMGKSSLIARTVSQLQKKRLRSVVIDLQGMTAQDMTAEMFYAGLLDACIRQLALPVDLTRWWQEHELLSVVQRFMNFITDEVLARVSKRLVIFVDEIDAMLNRKFSDDFFAAIRAFYNDRTHNSAYKRLTVVLVGSASPSDLVKDRTRSPFNIGHRIELTDFTFDEARQLTAGLSLDELQAAQALAQVLDWTGGQPYLTQKVCAALAADAHVSDGEQRVERLVKALFFSDAPWSDPNLQGVRDRLMAEQDSSDAVLDLYRRIIAGEHILDDERSPVHAALKLSGIVKVFPGGVLRPRNRIYEGIFHSGWVDTVRGAHQVKNPHQTIAELEAQIAELRRRLGDGPSIAPSAAEAVATTGGVAAGQWGVAVGGNVYGNIYTGAPPRDAAEALRIYRQVLVESCRHVSLRGLDIGASDPTSKQQHFDLSQVYVELLTTTQVPQDAPVKSRRRQRESLTERDTRLLSALEAIAGHRRMVLLGDPGSGKSTCLTYLTYCLAAHTLEPDRQWLTQLPKWPQQEADIVPVPVVLRDFAQWIPSEAKKAEPGHLWRFLVDRLEAQNLAFATEALHERLHQGQAMLLLDGLDEIPTPRQRAFVRDAVAIFARRYPKCRLVVTCRTLSYQQPEWQLDDFETFTLAPFTAEQIDDFIARWHAELARLGSIKPGAVDVATRHLQATVRRPDLWRLASNPLLLTVITLVHTHKGRLPEVRALLYKEAVEILLWRWDQVRVSGEDQTPRLQQLLVQANSSAGKLQSKLERLAFEAHREGGTIDTEGVADIGEAQLSRALIELHPDRSHDWAHQVIEVIKLRAGLLLERAPAVYTFPHRTFQEYLAGAHLATEPDFAQQAARLAAQGAFWREVIAAGSRPPHACESDDGGSTALDCRVVPSPACGNGRGLASGLARWRCITGDGAQHCPRQCTGA